MNIQDFWPTEDETSDAGIPFSLAGVPPKIAPEFWLQQVIEPRRKTFRGFLEVEASRGQLKTTHLSSSQGQEMIRILLFRVFEELAESMLSNLDEHRKEELIDAFNYLISIPFLDEELFPCSWLQNCLLEAHAITMGRLPLPDPAISNRRLGGLMVMVCGELGDTLRNRAWMKHAQDVYFSGTTPLSRVIISGSEMILGQFTSTREFWKYFISKDRVLQFRLRSDY